MGNLSNVFIQYTIQNLNVEVQYDAKI